MDAITHALEEKQATDISVIDVSKFSPITDFFVVCTSGSTPQTRALMKEVEGSIEAIGMGTPPWQGKPESNWMILDLGSVIVHIMGLEERKRYSLEEMWERSSVTYHM